MPASSAVNESEEGEHPDRPSAIALSYANKNRAPIVVAKGYGAVADSIVQRARESGLYVHESPDLVKLLMHVKLDAEIPPQLYLAIAEILAWLYRLEPAQRGNAHPPSSL
ncbi:MAG: EscU/YscU/HrcU family type III secretion system export apparatus switch protein [Polaromonas sp.]